MKRIIEKKEGGKEEEILRMAIVQFKTSKLFLALYDLRQGFLKKFSLNFLSSSFVHHWPS